LQGNWRLDTTTVVYLTKNGLLASDPCDDFQGRGALRGFCSRAPKALVMPLLLKHRTDNGTVVCWSHWDVVHCIVSRTRTSSRVPTSPTAIGLIACGPNYTTTSSVSRRSQRSLTALWHSHESPRRLVLLRQRNLSPPTYVCNALLALLSSLIFLGLATVK